MQRLIPLFLAGCAIVGNSAHQQRIDALSQADADTDADADADTDADADADTDTDTDADTDTDPVVTAPQFTDLDWRFRFSGFNIYEGIQLAVRVTDTDDDIAALVIQGGEEVPWAHAIARADDWYLVPIALDLGAPCDLAHSAHLEVFLRDEAGNTSAVQSLDIRYDGYLHDETNINSADECEPCVGGLTTMDLPFVACGIKHSQGYIDFYDGVGITAEGNWGEINATLNYGQDAAGLRFGLVYPPSLDWVEVREGSNTIGYAINHVVPADPTSMEFSVDASSYFFSGTWTMFLQESLPPPIPAP